MNIIKKLASLKITVICLFLLFILTLLGTLARIDQGLYVAQQRYFFSFIVWVGNIFPLPAGRLILWILFINLSAVTITRFIHYQKWRYIGLLTIHFGLILYFIAAFLLFHKTQESYVQLLEGHQTNVSNSYFDWEVSIWKENGESKEVWAYPTNTFLTSKALIAAPICDTQITVNEYYTNVDAFLNSDNKQPIFLNSSNIVSIRSKALDKEKENNIPGMTFSWKSSKKEQNILLYGGEDSPTQVFCGEGKAFIQLRQIRHVLPFDIKLIDFRAKFHPGTQMAKSFESDVLVNINGVKRQSTISMNNPFRYKEYTLYQAAYRIDDDGKEFSTLAVVKNQARLWPYVASLLTFLGLAIHLIIQGLRSKQ